MFWSKNVGDWVHDKGRVSAREEAVWVLLGMQHESQCEYKTGENFGP